MRHCSWRDFYRRWERIDKFGWFKTLRVRWLEKFERAQAWSGGKSVADAFEGIYRDGKWGQGPDGEAYWSGNGSQPDFSAQYEAFVADFFERNPSLSSIVDIGCGDFQVSGRLLSRLGEAITYTGCDVVAPLIAHHQETYGTPRVRFVQLNAVEEDPPAGDVVIIRQVLPHLSNAQAVAILERVRRLFKVVIVTESLPKPLKEANLDIVHGIATRIALGSGIYVDLPPFNLDVSEVLDVDHTVNETLRTSIVWF